MVDGTAVRRSAHERIERIVGPRPEDLCEGPPQTSASGLLRAIRMLGNLEGVDEEVKIAAG